MTLSFSTLGCPAWDVRRIFDTAARLGYAAVELRGIGDNIDVDTITELLPANRAGLRRLMTDSGVGICALDCSAAFATDSAAKRGFAETAYAIEAAAELGVPYVRVFGDRLKQPESEVYARIADNLCRLADIAARSGVTVLLETHGDFNTIDRIGRICDSVDCGGFGLLWDIEHTYKAGVDSEEFAERFGALIKHIHMKDIDRDGKLCLPGDGIINPSELTAILDKIGYSGHVSLEWEKRWQKELAEPDEAFSRYVEWMPLPNPFNLD